MPDRVRKEEYERLAAFRYAIRQFLHFSEEKAASVGLKPQQHQALLSTLSKPGRERVTISELADHLQVRHHSAVGLADRLEKMGLMQREADPEDRRRVFVSATPRGRELLERLSTAHREELRRISPYLQELVKALAE